MIGSLAVTLVALLLASYLYLKLKRFRRDQLVVMGEGRERDVVAHARAQGMRVDELAHDLRRLTADLEKNGQRIEDCIAFRSVIRYDAYRDLSGMQSTSVALLDGRYSGIILSAIQSRDHARLYVKEVRHGESREKLSPEEIQVLKEAMGIGRPAPRTAEGGSGA